MRASDSIQKWLLGLIWVGSTISLVMSCAVAQNPGSDNSSNEENRLTLVSGQTGTGSLLASSNDSWTFTANQGQYLVLSVGDPTAANLDPEVTLTGPDGMVIRTSWGGYGCSVSASISATGTYTAVVNDHGHDNSGNYTISLVLSGGGLTITPGDEGGPVVSGATKTGTIGYGDIDGWTFAATEGQHIIASAGDPTGSNFDPEVTLIGPDGMVIGTSWGGYGCSVSAHVSKSGTFTLVVNDHNHDNAGDYAVSLVLSGGGLTISSGDDGGPILSGATKTGKIGYGDTDGWTFKATQGQYIMLSAGDPTASNVDPEVTLIGPDATIIGTSWGGYGCSLSASASTTGDFTLVVNDHNHDNSGDYTLSLVLSGGGLAIASGDEGGSIVSGVPKSGSIGYGDLDGWTFVATAGQNITVTATDPSSSRLDPEVTLISPDGRVLATSWSGETTRVTSSAALSGTYTIVVNDRGHDNSGTYTVSLTTN